MQNKKNNPTVSIIIVSFNVKELLRKCILSIEEKFVGISYEIIVVDNNSKDRNQEMIENHFPAIRLVKNKANLGFAQANNQGIKIAKGEYIILINSDTEIMNNHIKDAIAHMEENLHIGILGPKIFFPNGNLQTSAVRFRTILSVFAHHFKLKNVLPSETIRKFVIINFGKFLGKTIKSYLQVYREDNNPFMVDWVTGAFMLIRKEVFKDIGYLDEDYVMYSEDEDFCLRANKAGWKMVYYPRLEIIHHVGASVTGNPLISAERYRSSLIFWHKHHPFWKVFIVRAITFISFGIKYTLPRKKEFKVVYRQILKYTIHNLAYIKTHRFMHI
ncbi:glycosyltransferase family 2 protein [Chloroflexota bacterium]